MRYIPNSPDERAEMLRQLGAASIDNLFDSIPETLRLRDHLSVPAALSEIELLKKFELDETHTFRLFIKPFMDALTWDEDRIDRCCTHVIRPDGKLDSFCRYYSGFPTAKLDNKKFP